MFYTVASALYIIKLLYISNVSMITDDIASIHLVLYLILIASDSEYELQWDLSYPSCMGPSDCRISETAGYVNHNSNLHIIYKRTYECRHTVV